MAFNSIIIGVYNFPSINLIIIFQYNYYIYTHYFFNYAIIDLFSPPKEVDPDHQSSSLAYISPGITSEQNAGYYLFEVFCLKYTYSKFSILYVVFLNN